MFRPVLTVPLYHHVAEAPIPATAHIGVTTATPYLEAHLERYARAYDIVDLGTVLSGKLPKRPLLLTFDDCFRSMLTTVAPILRRRRLPALIFLNLDPIEHRQPMFDHVLSALVHRRGSEAVLAALGVRAAGATSIHDFLNGSAIDLDGGARTALLAQLQERLDVPPAALADDLDIYLTEAETRLLADSPGIEIGNHTVSHVRCRSVAPEALELEIVSARQRLERLTGRRVRAFSFPYGARADATPQALAAIRRSGHEVAFLAQGRRTRIVSDPGLLWDRVPLDGTTPATFVRRLMVEPLVRGFKDMARVTLPGYLPAS